MNELICVFLPDHDDDLKHASFFLPFEMIMILKSCYSAIATVLAAATTAADNPTNALLPSSCGLAKKAKQLY